MIVISGIVAQSGLPVSKFPEITPPTVISLAKKEEEIFLPGQSEPLRLSRHAFALRLLQYVRDESVVGRPTRFNSRMGRLQKDENLQFLKLEY